MVRISKQYHPFINGAGGENVRRLLADRPNVRINIPPLSVHKDEISVAGEKEGVMAVIQQIDKMQKEMVSRSTKCVEGRPSPFVDQYDVHVMIFFTILSFF